MRSVIHRTLRFVVPLLFLWPFSAKAGVIDFEGLSDGTAVTTQYSGLTFLNGIILTSGISLNEFEFPPHSGSNVVSDDGGALSILFNSPVTNVSAYLTYSVPVTLTALDSQGHQLGFIMSIFSSNLTLSGQPGSSPNELLQVSFDTPIVNVTFTGDAAGGSFALDDLTYTVATSGVPEPHCLWLVAGGLSILILKRKIRP